jgi:3-deoxy-7-phosphoheptulonate synthase
MNLWPEPKYPGVLSRMMHREKAPIIIAGPCSVESEEQINEIAEVLKQAGGVTFMRGGVYRAGTYPPDDFGFKEHIAAHMAYAARTRGLKTIIEVLDIRLIETIDRYADAFQVGARHMQDYALLRELAQAEKPVTLKRNMGANLDEFLGAAEYLCRGKCYPILIERGSASFMTHVRWDLSLSVIASVKLKTGIPILCDGSHGTGRADLVRPMTKAGLAAGADGYLVEVHPKPNESLSDAAQAIPLSEFADFKEDVGVYYRREI